jgi:precorrin-2 dehydrogenase/sirohydrochlorin ferrochelatase
MKYYPVFLNLKGCAVLLIGGGHVALQKIGPLLDGDADVHLVAPKALPEIRQLARDGKIRWSARSYKSSDLTGVRLVIAATDEPVLQKRIAAEARARQIWVNVVDVPKLCDFIAPAVVRRGDIQIAISTGGAAPAVAKHLRKKLQSLIGQEYADLVKVLQTWRPAILKLPKDRRASFWKCVASDSFFQDIRRHGIPTARRRLKSWLYDD